MSERLIIAMPKGRIFKEAARLMASANFQLPDELDESRKLMIDVPSEQLTFILAKPMDVATYVEHGVADIGIAGKDVLLEEERDVYEVLDLHISKCHLAVAGLPGTKAKMGVQRVATKYPHIATTYFREKGAQVEIIPLNGSIELAPMIGLSDRIVDIVSTGQTLKENGLVELEKIVEVTSRLIVNPVSYRMKAERIDDLVARLSEVVEVAL